jgi:ribosomal protein L3 glutamine methyltransferase
MKPCKPRSASRSVHPETPGEWLKFAIRRYKSAGVSLGQVSDTAHDEALYLILRTLRLPLESGPDVLQRRLTVAGRKRLAEVFRRRIEERVPAPYLVGEAWFGGERFHVDERVIVPRSYFVEIIPGQLDAWLRDPGAVRRVIDVGTGSGCLAVLLARHFPKARVDAIDVSAEALAVARRNIRAKRLQERIRLFESSVFDRVPRAKYDVILSNPPYEPSAQVDSVPVEFSREPRLALDGGPDGLAIVRKLLRQSADRLKPEGIVVIEVGGLREAIDREFAALEPHWLHTADGSDCVCLFQAARLKAGYG